MKAKCKSCARCEKERSHMLKNGTVVEIGPKLYAPHRFAIKLPGGTISWSLCNEFRWREVAVK